MKIGAIQISNGFKKGRFNSYIEYLGICFVDKFEKVVDLPFEVDFADMFRNFNLRFFPPQIIDQKKIGGYYSVLESHPLRTLLIFT